MRELSTFRDLVAELDRRFPNRLPDVPASTPPAEVSARLHRLLGQRDVITVIEALFDTDPGRRTASPIEE